MKLPGRKPTFRISAVLSIALATMAVSGCGVEPHTDAPEIRFMAAQVDDNGVNALSDSVVETKIELSNPEDRTVFLEILTDEEYSRGKSRGLVPGDDWGGNRLTARNNGAGVATFDLRNADYALNAGQKYWLRSGVLIGQRDIGVLVSLVEMPIDKRSGHLFETISADRKSVV